MEPLSGRVIEVQRVLTAVLLPDDTILYATVRGQFHETGDYPKVGDLVELQVLTESEEAQAVIESILPRTSVIERYDEVNNQSQILVANVTVIMIVMGLDGDFSIPRLERYLALAAKATIPAVIVLNKADQATDLSKQIAAVNAAVGEVPVHLVQANQQIGLEELTGYFRPDTIAVLLGSSGAGKSTITNWLLQEERQAVQDVRDDDSRGRHTTTTRQLFTLPGGGYLIDTPGMRELALVADHTPETVGFAEIEALAMDCRFRNCDHDKSAGCAVTAAVERGELSARTLENYRKLARERQWQVEKTHGGKGQYDEQLKKRSAQAKAAQERKRLRRG